MKKQRVKGLERMYVKALVAEAVLDKQIERLATWGVQQQLGVRNSDAIQGLIAQGWSPPRTQRVATKPAENKFAEGSVVELKEAAALDILDSLWEPEEQDVNLVTGLKIVKLKRKSDKPNAPRVIVVENQHGNRFEVRPSQLKA